MSRCAVTSGYALTLYAPRMKTRRHRTARNLRTLALHAPFVAAHRLTHGLASTNPMTSWLEWQSVVWEKWFACTEVARAIAGAGMRGPRKGAAMLEHLADVSLAPLARRVRSNSTAIVRKAVVRPRRR